MVDDPEVPTVSVVIPTWNSAKSIRTTLASITNQTYPSIEVITVDRFSSDDTELIIRQNFPDATIIRTGGERSLQKNTGARSAKGKYVYFVDSDFVVERGVIAEAVAACEGGFEGAIIHNTSDPRVSFWSRVRKLERDTYYRDPEHVAVRFVRRDLFFRVGGFDEDIIAGEDYDLHTRVLLSGARLCWVRGLEFHVGEPKRLTDVVTKHIYYGKNVLNYVRKQFRLRLWQLSPFRRSYVSNMHMFFENPSLLVGFVLYQYVRYASTLAGLLASTLSPATAPHPRYASSTSALDPIQLLQRVSIVLVTRNRASEFYDCVRSLQSDIDRGAELVVVDDSSDIPYGLDLTGITRIANAKRMFLNGSRNRGASSGSRDFILFVDDDNSVGPGVVARLAGLLEVYRDIGVAAPVILTDSGRIWYAGGWVSPLSGLTVFNYRGHLPDSLPEGQISTHLFHSCFMVRRSAFEEAGGFDAENFPMYLGEADLSERLSKQRYQVIVDSGARIAHHIPDRGFSSVLRNVHITEPSRAYFVGRNRIIFMRKHRNLASYFIFVIVFLPVIALIHLTLILTSRAGHKWTTLAGAYLRGILDGLGNRVKYGKGLVG